MSMTAQDHGWVPYQPCLCGCEVIGWKLTKLLPNDTIQHVVGCECIRHRNKRNRVKGRAAQHRGHKRLGGVGMSPLHEEAGRTYSVEHQIEFKYGSQIPANLMNFARSTWARHAWGQAERAVPAGVEANPTIYAEREGWVLLVTLLHRGKK